MGDSTVMAGSRGFLQIVQSLTLFCRSCIHVSKAEIISTKKVNNVLFAFDKFTTTTFVHAGCACMFVWICVRTHKRRTNELAFSSRKLCNVCSYYALCSV